MGCVRHRQAHLAVECLLEGSQRPEEAIALPLEALGDVEGKDDAPVILEAATPGRTTVRWDDRGIPQSREYAVPEIDSCRRSRAPRRLRGLPGGALDALAEAAATTEEGSTRYAPELIQLKGDCREVVATDGRQISSRAASACPGRATCWSGHAAVREQGAAAATGRSGSAGRRPRRAEGRGLDALSGHPGRRRFPRVEHVVPDARFATTRLALDPQDAGSWGSARPAARRRRA
ncbi:MAG: hypothetical protein WKF75_14785 [Singulisphaera sp.]